MTETFKVIGRCSKMQALSLDQETKLWEGIPYEINFYQDFSRMYLDGRSIEGTPVPALIEATATSPGRTAIYPAPKEISERERQAVLEALEEQQKRDRKLEKRWKKEHPKLSKKEAWRNYERTMKRILGDDYDYYD